MLTGIPGGRGGPNGRPQGAPESGGGRAGPRAVARVRAAAEDAEEAARAAAERAASVGEVGDEAEEEPAPRLWHVVLSVAGKRTPLPELRRGLEQLAHDHPFLLTGRYAEDHAEIRYWEQARDLHDAAALALRLWGEHRVSARLPAWEIVGLEVVDRPTYHKRVAEGFGGPPAFLGGVHPY
ncbi:hypothetical protein [Phaeacidiphilus oryzae]|uniref:hypothetical protein n=1 Tax=Phaeacidiphilus oryzae TaxID=348818 RepID=UPI000A0240E7|nr:hypothetical protein [Phaeacidiphilus oryzae]